MSETPKVVWDWIVFTIVVSFMSGALSLALTAAFSVMEWTPYARVSGAIAAFMAVVFAAAFFVGLVAGVSDDRTSGNPTDPQTEDDPA